MGLDIGDSRIGVALSDPMGILASPMAIVARTEEAKDIQDIIDIATKNEADRIIVGMPFNMNGSLGRQAEKVQRFTESLREQTDIPIEYRDERLSTVEAKDKMQSVRKAGRKIRYDAVAAALILQSYLDEMAGQSRK